MYGLIFDVDGVIADTEAVNAQASIQVFAELLDIEGVRREDFEAGLGRGAAAYVPAAAHAHGVELDDAQVDAATAARQATFLSILDNGPLPAFPGVLELMTAALEHDDFEVAIATSSTREKSQAVLESAGVPWTELVYITGSDVTHRKPHPELFLLAAREIGVDPPRCIVIEDAPNGVKAAHAAGAMCIAVTNSLPAGKLAAADRVVDSLAGIEIEDLLRLFGAPH